MSKFLESSKYIDSEDESIVKLANKFQRLASSRTEVIKLCFEFVRDNILHSSDFQLNPVTCVASEVLEHKTGFCYAKSHLLAALLKLAQ